MTRTVVESSSITDIPGSTSAAAARATAFFSAVLTPSR